jgi:hypothetical protein
MATGSTLSTSVYTQTYTSFSGADIRAIFHQDLMINIQGLSYSITREKAPIYSMGRPDPWSFSRGISVCLSTLLKTVESKLKSMTIPWLRDSISMAVQTC